MKKLEKNTHALPLEKLFQYSFSKWLNKNILDFFLLKDVHINNLNLCKKQS